MHHFQVPRQVTMGAGPSSSLVIPSNDVFDTREAGSPRNLAAQHSQVTHGISGTMGLSPNLLGQHSQVTRGASGTIGAAPPPNLVKQLEARHGVN